jgi:SAM-dependent methyltransferase
MAGPTFLHSPASYDAEFLDTMASEYLERTPWTRLRLAAVTDLVEPRPGDRILDLGCAAGATAHHLSTFGSETVGVDSAPLAIERARALFPDLTFEVADVAALPFEAGSFDKAVAADLVEHIDDETFERMLAELRRVLVPGGSLTIYTPNARHVIERLKARELVLAQNPTHIAVRSAAELSALLRARGFVVERNEWRASHFPGWNVLERLGGRAFASLRYRLCIRASTPVDTPAR